MSIKRDVRGLQRQVDALTDPYTETGRTLLAASIGRKGEVYREMETAMLRESTADLRAARRRFCEAVGINELSPAQLRREWPAYAAALERLGHGH